MMTGTQPAAEPASCPENGCVEDDRVRWENEEDPGHRRLTRAAALRAGAEPAGLSWVTESIEDGRRRTVFDGSPRYLDEPADVLGAVAIGVADAQGTAGVLAGADMAGSRCTWAANPSPGAALLSQREGRRR